MPSDPAIKAALEKARQARCGTRMGWQAAACTEACKFCIAESAAAIAAFLRVPGMDGLLGGAHVVAAAVEAAAREGMEGQP